MLYKTETLKKFFRIDFTGGRWPKKLNIDNNYLNLFTSLNTAAMCDPWLVDQLLWASEIQL